MRTTSIGSLLAILGFGPNIFLIKLMDAIFCDKLLKLESSGGDGCMKIEDAVFNAEEL